MKKTTITFLLIILTSSLLVAATIEQEFDFTKPQIQDIDNYQRILSSEMTSNVDPGSPEIPSRAIKVLLPSGENITSIKITSKEHEILSGRYNIIPQQTPYPIGFKGDTKFTEPNSSIYEHNDFYPQLNYTKPNVQYFRGHSIALINLYPIQYNPVTNKIKFSSILELTIETKPEVSSSQAFHKFYRNDLATKKRLKNIVENPQLLYSYPQTSNYRDEIFDYVIITNNSFITTFNDFISLKQAQGYSALLKTTEEIYSEYDGIDNQDKIRNFIIDAYQNMGTEYVLLGGDTNIVPYRGFWVAAGETIDYGIPSDMYYGSLDRTGTGTGPDWNVDNDDKWGEHNEADYLSEVNVGRISADNITELTAALNKQIMYQDDPVINDLEKALMVGEELNDSPYTFGGDYKDEIVDGGNYNGYTTAGIDDNINIETLYDREFYWSSNQLFNKMNDGLNFINHLGHSNIDYNMKTYMSSVTDQNITANGIDRNFFLVYSQGCLPAAIDANCIAEKFTTIDNGCAVFVGNSRYGWYMPGGTNSSSQFLDRQFFDALFDENIYTVGAMNVDSKDDGANQCNNDWFRWAVYEVNVLGDPSINVWTAEPTDLIAVYPPSISIGSDEISFQTDAPYCRISLVQNGEIIGKETADENGDATVTTFSPITNASVIEVAIMGHNKHRYNDEIVVVSNEPYVIFEELEINDQSGNGNGLADYSESIDLDLTLRNVGNQTANSISAVISTDDEFITITDDNGVYGDITAQSNSLLEGAFSLDIAETIPDQHIVELTLEATDINNQTWTSNFTITLNAPLFEMQNIIVDDSNGNNNGILDPGETAFFIIETANIGHADSPDTFGSLNNDNDQITIESSISNLGSIPAQNSSNAVYTISADNTTPLATIVNFEYIVFADDYIYETSFQHSIGLIVEDFETGDFTSFPWEFTGNADWIISDGAYEGDFCAKSEQIGHNSSTGLRIETDISNDGEISFWRTVSSEANYDYLRFYIDGTQMGEWSGDEGWVEVSYPVNSGSHSFTWKYEKDQAVTGGTDCARIDYIIFPSLGAVFPPILSVEPNVVNVELPTNEVLVDTLHLSNIGGDILEYSITVPTALEWLDFSPESGSINMDETDDIELTFDSTDLSAGDYTTALTINYYLGEQQIIPVIMNVSETNTENNLLPEITELSGNYPNPFNPSGSGRSTTTNIKFSLNADSQVSLSMYNIKGQKVRTLITDKLDAGYHTVVWDGKNDSGKSVASGIYFSAFDAQSSNSDYTNVKKVILLK